MFADDELRTLSMGIQGAQGASEFAYQNAAQYATDRLQGRSARLVFNHQTKPAAQYF